MRVLVVGGAGYIGSVVTRLLITEGHDVVILDNLSRGHKAAVPPSPGCLLIEGDMGDRNDLAKAFSSRIDAVMHFAALSLVGESVEKPAQYFENNVTKGLALLNMMIDRGVKKFIFSSTAAVYGEPEGSPITEDFALSPTSPYGESKLAFEKILKWYSLAYGLKYVSLRYFNAAGACGELGEHHEPETHLIPIVLQVALRVRSQLTIFGDNYDTPDGTCIRDYIHVQDLALAHAMALQYLAKTETNQIFNLGQGSGFSVKEVVSSAERVTGRSIPTVIGARRAGDPAILIASNDKIRKTIGWTPQYSDIDRIIQDAWSWHREHPRGYEPGANKVFFNMNLDRPQVL